MRVRRQLSHHLVHARLDGGPPRLPVLHPWPHCGQLVAEADAEAIVYPRPASQEQERDQLPHVLPHGSGCDNGCGE